VGWSAPHRGPSRFTAAGYTRATRYSFGGGIDRGFMLQPARWLRAAQASVGDFLRARRRRWLTRKIALALAMAAFVALALATLDYRHHAHRPGAAAIYRDTGGDTPYSLAFVEFDDQGWLWQPAQADSALELVEQTAARSDTFVVVYVHGWHHDASCCDRNVECFKALLAKLSHRLRARADGDRGSAAQNRPSAYRVVGIYIGWRGRSMPGWLDYLTFWGRKAAAERVGEGDLREFLLRLDRLHDEHRATETGHRSLGLITIAHSFGALAVFRTLGPRLESLLVRASPAPGYLRGNLAAPAPLEVPLDGIGDLTVLVNPALKAAEFERIRRLAQELHYPTSQSPILLVIAAENDLVSRWWFPLDRIAARWSRLGATFAPDQGELETSALGVYPAQQSHRLAPTTAAELQGPARRRAQPGAASDPPRPCACPWISHDPPADAREHGDTLTAALLADLERVRTFDFSDEVAAGGVRLAPLGGLERIGYLPFLVSRADPQVIDGHNGLFTSAFADFLVPYMVFVESKKHFLHGDGS